MGCTGTVRFHTPLGAPHNFCSFHNIHFLPVTQQKSLPLTGGQLLEGFLYQSKHLRTGQLFDGLPRRFAAQATHMQTVLQPPEGAVVLAAMTAVILLTLAALLAAGPLMRLVGHRMEAMITRLLGVILAALAAQFVIDGISVSFAINA